MASGFLVIISFFTRIPIGSRVEYDEDCFKSALGLYSLMGVVIGLFLALACYVGDAFHSAYVRGLLVTLSYMVVTGGIHFDGAADSADGLFSGRTGERIFEIMSDSHIGSFGVLCLIFIVLSQFVLFSNLSAAACFLVPVVGRTAAILGSYHKKYAKKNKGMGTVFIESINIKILISNIVILIASSVVFNDRIIFVAASSAALLISCQLSKWVEKKIGGMTGDTCGFVTEISQVMFMFLLLLIKGISI